VKQNGNERLKGIRISESYWKRCKIASATLGIPMHRLVEQGLDLRFKNLKAMAIEAGKVRG